MKTAPLLALLCALSAHAEAPPVDPWTDAAWADVMYGLVRGKVARLHATQQLYDVQASTPGTVSTREVQLEFELPDGRVSRLALNEERRGESGSRRSFRYVYEAGALRRIDEDGQATPAVTRRYDAAGRPVEHAERTGAVVARTTWRYDAAGRLIERLFDSGAGSRSKETRRYRRDGTLERLDVDGGTLVGKRVDFDASERPVRIRVTDLLDRRETKISYPSPLEAIHETNGFAVARGGGRFAYTTGYRVRTPQELRGVEAPELPTMRRSVRGTSRDEVQTDYDAAGRLLAEHSLDAGGHVACTGRIAYHPSGPPVAVRNERARPDARCEGGDLDNEISADERGSWAKQRMWLLRPDGQRRLMSVQTRRIEYAP
jgi:YD repeat-containing protein